MMSQDTTRTAAPKEKHWYEKISLKGYTQLRYNRLLETNPDLKCESCDRSWGRGNGFSFRRVRLTFTGQIHDRVSMYIQGDLAQSVSATSLHYLQLRDAYFDIWLDAKKRFRVRPGLSKVPFGFDNMQSSQVRLPMDRSDPINSGAPNERDLGVFFYWAPVAKREIFKEITDKGQKGSGDYGCFGIGIYNGQSNNKPELNDRPHIVGRFAWPVRVGSQILEAGVQAYTGTFTLDPGQISKNVTYNADRNYLDRRAAASFTLYPRPFGIQAEYNIGTGPEYNPATNSITNQRLSGGYVLLSGIVNKWNMTFIPFTRLQYYDGGKKIEQDARSYTVKEMEAGVEWQIIKNLELTASYVISDRRFEDAATIGNHQKGNLLRLQLQFNY